MKRPLLVYLDTDHSTNGLYDYRQPHFEAAASLGWHRVTLLDKDHPHREEIVRSCDDVISIDEVTLKSVVDAVVDLQKRYDVRAITTYPGQNVPDFDALGIIEKVSELLGFPRVPADAIKRCNNKFLMRKRLDSVGLPNVSAAMIQNEAELLVEAQRMGFPVIFKPVFGAGSALVRKCDTAETLQEHYRRYRKDYRHTASAYFYGGSKDLFQTDDGTKYHYIPGQTALLERYIDGVEATIECIVHNGRPIPLMLQEKMLVTHERATVLEHLLITPSARFTPEQEEQAKAYCVACVEAMELDMTFVHFEFRLTDDGPRVIEINPRVGGFYVPRALKDLIGLDPFVTNLLLLSGALSNHAVGRAEQIARKKREDYHTMFVVYPPASGHLVAIDGVEHAVQRPGILDFRLATTPRSIERETEEDYAAKFWGRAESEDAVRQLYSDILLDLTISVDSDAG